MNKPRILFWHRKDLRIFDNQALIKAFSLSNAITSTYILDKNYSNDFNADSRAWFLGNSLEELSKLNSEVKGDLDEDIEVLMMDPEELDNLISSGDEILDAKTVTAWFRAKQFLDNL